MTNTPAEPDVTVRCSRCRGAIVVDADTARQLARHGAAMTHEVCPGEPIRERHFEVTCTIVERQLDRDENGQIVAGDVIDNDDDGGELARFTASVRGRDLADAMRPLALELGAKWQRVEEQAHVADPRRDLIEPDDEPAPVDG